MKRKASIMSGKLKGTRNLISEFNDIKDPDEIEKFLKDFINLSFYIASNNEIIEVESEENLNKVFDSLMNETCLSLFPDDSFQKLCITTKNDVTYSIKIQESSIQHINTLISSEKVTKYTLNGFSILKWCHKESIEPKNVVDLLVQIKILTDNVEIIAIEDYVKKYVKNKDAEENVEKYKGIFIIKFGEYLTDKINEFELASVCKIIGDNSYSEGISQSEENEMCRIILSYAELDNFIKENMNEFLKKYEKKAYIKSPLGRIALKFGNDLEDLVQELCGEDLEINVLSEMYDNNLRVSLIDDNCYEIVCRYSSFNTVISIVVAIMKDTFYKLFERKSDIKMECLLK